MDRVITLLLSEVKNHNCRKNKMCKFLGSNALVYYSLFCFFAINTYMLKATCTIFIIKYNINNLNLFQTLVIFCYFESPRNL